MFIICHKQAKTLFSMTLNHKFFQSVCLEQGLFLVLFFPRPWVFFSHAFADQLLFSVTKLPLTLCNPMVILHYLLKFAQIHVGDAIQPSHPLLLPSPAFNFSQHQGLFNVSSLCITWPKYQNFSFSISHSNEYSWLISFRIYWFDLIVQGILKSLLQNHNSKAPVLQSSIFFMAQLSHLYMTNGKSIALTVRTFVGKVICFFL